MVGYILTLGDITKQGGTQVARDGERPVIVPAHQGIRRTDSTSVVAITHHPDPSPPPCKNRTRKACIKMESSLKLAHASRTEDSAQYLYR